MALRTLATALLLAASPLVLASPVGAQTAPAAKANSAELAAFFEQVDADGLAQSPQGKAYRGIRDADYGKWNDPSDAKAVADFERGQKALATMKARFDPAKLSTEDALSYRLFEYQAERAAKAHPFRRNDYVFDQMNGAQSQMPAFLINIHRVASKSDAEAYVARLQGIGPRLDGLIAESRTRAEAA